MEELIPNVKETFVKYIHNGTCRPLLHLDDPEYNIAEFLAFTQHVQYNRTGGMAYISDYQGKSNIIVLLLTDIFRPSQALVYFSPILRFSLIREPCDLFPTSLILTFTNRSVGEGLNLFCEGNIKKGVEQFAQQHLCNKYCKWFKLSEFQGSTEIAPMSSGVALSVPVGEGPAKSTD